MTNAKPTASGSTGNDDSGQGGGGGAQPHDDASTFARTRASPDLPGTRTTLLGALRDVIAALDRRLPHRDGEGERAIARDAASLRHAAVARVERLEQEECAGLRGDPTATA